MTKEEVDVVAQGRVWSGQEAFDRKLVDKLGGLREALAEARRLGHLSEDAPFEELPKVEKTLLDSALGMVGLHASGADSVLAVIPQQVKDVAIAIAPVALFAGDVPLARLEWVSAGEP